MKKRYKIPLISLGILIGIFFIFVLIRIPYFFREKKTQEQVVKIHNTKLTMDDVMGNNLPPDPGAEADKTIQGIDANKNGIRDDVELAIFKAYPDSAKTRAVLLQYALALQMEVVQSIINEETVTAVAQDSGRAHLCVGDIVSRDDMNKFIEITEKFYSFIESRQLNTEERKNAQKDFYSGNLKSYSSPVNTCDLNISVLYN